MTDMIDEECPFCDGEKFSKGYGEKAGPTGHYAYCDGCGELVSYTPDMEKLSEADKKIAKDIKDDLDDSIRVAKEDNENEEDDDK